MTDLNDDQRAIADEWTLEQQAQDLVSLAYGAPGPLPSNKTLRAAILEALRFAVEAEREACFQVCAELARDLDSRSVLCAPIADRCAAAIRARGSR